MSKKGNLLTFLLPKIAAVAAMLLTVLSQK
jgi:hypothetical protein